MYGLRVRKLIVTEIIFYLSFVQVLKCEDNTISGNYPTISKYARMKQLFPRPSPSEANDWNSADTNDAFRTHPCNRDCAANKSMTCYYYMVVHNDETMGTECEQFRNEAIPLANTDREYVLPFEVRMQDEDKSACSFADGIKTDVMLVNGQLPGQAIEVCEGDTIVADVINSMQESTTIHWHGIHQRKTPHMDGVPHITQYPIMPGQAFRYRFEAENAGTHWWHSHTNHQRAFGLAGPLLVRQSASENIHALMYDLDLLEHTVMLQDWVHNQDERVPQNILINGLGRNVHDWSTNQQNDPKIVYASFSVVQGARYRFRVIFNGVSNCPVSISIDNHDLEVIASDGNDMEPVIVQKIVLHGAERFDFVLHANQPMKNYWMRVKGYGICEEQKLHQEAILHYKGAERNVKPSGEVSYEFERNGLELNPIEQQRNSNDGGSILRLMDTNSAESRLQPPQKLFRTYYTSMSVLVKPDEVFFQMDDISFKLPAVSLLQARNLGVDRIFCNRSSLMARGTNCAQTNCACSNVIQVPASQYVEFVITSTTAATHPIHLHGYTFRVVGMGVLGKDRIRKIEDIDKRTSLPRRKRGGLLKDSVQVPGFGYTIIRFYTDNPGYWLFHCHISTHAERGMAAVLRVGDNTEMKLCPVSNCGLCSSVL